ncbi:MAG TPA: TolC family protein [Thermoanaerobaculia bacterium]
MIKKYQWSSLAIGIVGMFMLTANVFAQTSPDLPLAPRYDQPSISAGQAVQLGLTHDPGIHLAQKRLEFEEGLLQETSGQFDPSFQLGLDHSNQRGPLLPGPQRRAAGQRTLFRILSNVLQRVADDLRQNLADNAGERVFIDCDRLAAEGGEGVLSQGSEIVIINPETGERTAIRCTTAAERELQEANDAFLDALIAAAKDDEQREKLEALRLRGIELSRQVIQEVIEILDVVAAEQRERLRMLGVTPTIQHQILTSLIVGYRMPFRNGVAITPTFALQRTDEYLIAKRTIKNGFGGRSKPTTYQAALGLRVEAPLLRGRGYLAAAGAERAAELGVDASEDDYWQMQSASAFRTLLNYWTLVAAQQRLALFEESLGRQRELQGIARTLLEADEITRLDVLSVDARISDATNAVSSTRAGVNAARVALARDIGLRIDRLEDAPLASDDFPAVATEEQLNALSEEMLLHAAPARRFDLSAASRRVEASRVILGTAREGLRRRLDLGLTFGYLGFHESQNLSKGLNGALFDEWTGPSVLLTLGFELPLGNNVALGRFAQANALENQSVIARTELGRRVSTRIVQAVANLRHAAAAVRKQEEAASLYRRTISDEYTKYQAGVSTAIDVILTEENLTNTLASLIDARFAYATALARLRFEAGLLVRSDANGAAFQSADAFRLPY